MRSSLQERRFRGAGREHTGFAAQSRKVQGEQLVVCGMKNWSLGHSRGFLHARQREREREREKREQDSLEADEMYNWLKKIDGKGALLQPLGQLCRSCNPPVCCVSPVPRSRIRWFVLEQRGDFGVFEPIFWNAFQAMLVSILQSSRDSSPELIS